MRNRDEDRPHPSHVRPSLSLHSPLRGREERTTEGVSDERSTRSGEGTGLTTLLSVPSSLSFIIYSPGSLSFPLSFRYATRLRLTGVDRKGNEPRAGGNRGRSGSSRGSLPSSVTRLGCVPTHLVAASLVSQPAHRPTVVSPAGYSCLPPSSFRREPTRSRSAPSFGRRSRLRRVRSE